MPTPSTYYLNLQDLRNLRFKQFVKGKASVPACSCVQSCLACVLRGAGICLFLIKVLKRGSVNRSGTFEVVCVHMWFSVVKKSGSCVWQGYESVVCSLGWA
jgi:hypothetical protein